MEGVGVALAVFVPGFGGYFGPELVEGHGEGEAHVGEGDDLDAADGEGEVGRHGASVGSGWGDTGWLVGDYRRGRVGRSTWGVACGAMPAALVGRSSLG